MPLPPQETTVNHYYSSSRVGTILALFVVAMVTAVLMWHALVFLAGQVGVARPNQAAAYCLLGSGIVLGLLGGGGIVLKLVVRDFLLHRERMAGKMVELEQARSRTAQLIPATTQARMTREEARKYQAIKMAMDKAFRGKVDERGKVIGKTEPWSRRQVGAMTLLNERQPIGEDTSLAAWVKTYLLDRKILLNDRQVNVTEFPNLATVEAQLVKDFGPPIVYNSQGSDGDLGMSSHFIERGTGRESWS